MATTEYTPVPTTGATSTASEPTRPSSRYYTLMVFGCIVVAFFLGGLATWTYSDHQHITKTHLHSTAASTPLTNTSDGSFIVSMRDEVDWTLLDAQTVDHQRLSSQIESVMLQFLLKDPPVAVNPSCGSDDSQTIDDASCKAASTTAFVGLRQRPARVGIILQLGFDVDTLEIHLYELYDVVDFFFIIESVRTHRKNQPKPLMWQVLRTTKRFRRFEAKVVGFTLDDADSVGTEGGMWALESYQEAQRWVKFKAWNKRTGYFKGDDMLSFGDTDEIPSRHVVQLMKHCQPARTPIDVGIAFTMSHLDWMFRTDWPVGDLRFSLGDPSFYTVRDAMASKKSPSRQRGRSNNFVLGGAHLTSFTYLPMMVMRSVACTECGGIALDTMRKFRGFVAAGNVSRLEQWARDAQLHWLPRVTMYDQVIEERQRAFRVVPWVLLCNPDRYPAWRWQDDPRLH
jgi:hypothetical protein